ncbi:MAG: hypothetical protein LBN08_02075 [Lactobacillales bacterium]|nr:hypothetical protein [Lactobacillales bacterium]
MSRMSRIHSDEVEDEELTLDDVGAVNQKIERDKEIEEKTKVLSNNLTKAIGVLILLLIVIWVLILKF